MTHKVQSDPSGRLLGKTYTTNYSWKKIVQHLADVGKMILLSDERIFSKTDFFLYFYIARYIPVIWNNGLVKVFCTECQFH